MKADTDAAAQFGMAYPMGARMMSGNSNYHEQLERDLANFVQKSDCILLNYGYQGVLSAIDALVDRHDVIVYDAEAHACIIDGVRLHMGKRFVYNHNNIESLEQQLRRATKVVEATGGAILVITEGVFGMAGDQGLLKEIVALKKEIPFIQIDRQHISLNNFNWTLKKFIALLICVDEQKKSKFQLILNKSIKVYYHQK